MAVLFGKTEKDPKDKKVLKLPKMKTEHNKLEILKRGYLKFAFEIAPFFYFQMLSENPTRIIFH